MATTAPQDTDGAAGPRSRKGARTRERLLEAAKEVFEEDGFLEARVTDIAERASLSHGSFYYHFDSKEQIFREVAAAVDATLSAPLNEVILTPSTSPPRDRIREALRRHFESYRAEARIMGVIEQVSRYDDQVGSVRLARQHRYTQEVARSIRHLQSRGLSDLGLDPVVTGSALGALTSRFAELWLVEGGVDATMEDGVEQITRIFVNVLGLPG